MIDCESSSTIVTPCRPGWLDCSTQNVRIFARDPITGNQGVQLSALDGCDPSFIFLDWADECGDYIDSAFVPVDGRLNVDNGVGSEVFDTYLGGVTNRYIYTPPSSNPNPLTADFSYGALNPDGDMVLCEFSLPVDSCDSNATVEKVYNIDAVPLGPISTADWEAMTSNAHSFAGGNQNLLSIVDDGTDRWIQAEHLQGTTGTLSEICRVPAKTGNENYKVEQCILFADNFDHGGTLTANNSGKLGFGLGGGQSSTGGTVSGGSTDTTGWTVRFGFDVFNGVLQLATYNYYVNRPGMPSTSNNVFGHLITTGVDLIPGMKYFASVEVILNTPGNADGQLITVVNGVTMVTTGIQWMTGTPETDLVIFGSNHGGPNASAAPEDTYVRYKDIVVTCE